MKQQAWHCTFLLLLNAAVVCYSAPQHDSNALDLSFMGRRLLQRGLNCRSVHKACSSCRLARVPGTRRTELLCSVCDMGWRLRRDGQAKTCDCSPGFAMNTTVADATAWCEACPIGSYCAGGDLTNPGSIASTCPDGLTTVIAGAKSQAQCFTLPGFGRQHSRGDNGAIQLSGFLCPVGTYNVGRNTAGCQKCNPGLTTLTEGSSAMTDCVAPPGSYYERGLGRLCPRGTYSESYSSYANTSTCTPCSTGATTATEGSSSSAACSLATPGFYMSGTGTAEPCPVNTYSDQISDTTSCTPCPSGMRTKSPGASGVSLCLAPPGYELKPEQTEISECEVGYFKQDWNRNNCTKCGSGIITPSTGSVSRDACRVPAGWGILSFSPLVAQPCRSNTYGIAEDRPVSSNVRCVACSRNMFTPDTLGEPSLPEGTGYTGETSCRVAPGWGITQSGLAQECLVGFYNPGRNRLPCTKCPEGYTTLATGSNSSEACVVQPGWAYDANYAVPTPCGVGTYSVGGTTENPNAVCTPCSEGFTTQTPESTSQADCSVCTVGHGGVGCQLCGYNTYSAANVREGDSCQPCAPGTVSAQGSTEAAQCYQAMQTPARDTFSLSDDSYWTSVAAESSTACSLACSSSESCIMFRWAHSQGASCQLLQEYTGTEFARMYIAFEVPPTAAHFAVYQVQVSLNVGSLVRTLPGQRTLKQCMQACSADNSCELVSFPIDVEYGTCSMFASNDDADYISMLHVSGPKLMAAI